MRPQNGDFDPPGNKPPLNKGSGTPIGDSPGLLSSTGGLFGTSGALLIPALNVLNGNNSFYILDSNNFDTEEDCIYNFRQEDVEPNTSLSNFKIIIVYRNIGKTKVTFNVTTFRQGITTYNKDNTVTIQQGQFYTKSKVVNLGSNPGDLKLYTLAVNIINPGERPQLSFIRKKNDGPFALISATLYGTVDEKGKM